MTCLGLRAPSLPRRILSGAVLGESSRRKTSGYGTQDSGYQHWNSGSSARTSCSSLLGWSHCFRGAGGPGAALTKSPADTPMQYAPLPFPPSHYPVRLYPHSFPSLRNSALSSPATSLHRPQSFSLNPLHSLLLPLSLSLKSRLPPFYQVSIPAPSTPSPARSSPPPPRTLAMRLGMRKEPEWNPKDGK